MDLFEHAANRDAGRRSERRPSDARSVEPDPEPSGPQVVSVAQLTGEVERRLSALGRVAVEGEIGQLKRAGSGHVYFTLKDEQAALSCAIWRSRVQAASRTPLEEGQRVVCHGRLDVYKPRGTYSLIVERVERRGIGELLARLERLKAELKEAGRFDRSRSLPPRPRMVGVVTSRDADAWRDFLRTRSLRWPLYPVRLRHTRVQGPGAAEEVAAAIAHLAGSGVDVICVVRGGGSLEDLWTFNEAAVAEAVWNSPVPVVSGVGHETDHTLIDLVADHRAHTPTDAAQTVLPDRAELLERLELRTARLDDVADRLLAAREERLAGLARRRVLRDTEWLVEDRAQALADLRRRLRLAGAARLERADRALDGYRLRLADRSPAVRLGHAATRLARFGPRLSHAAERALESRATRLEVAGKALAAISPLAVLERGYSITRTQDGRALRAASQARPGEVVETILHQGTLRSTVDEVREGDAG